MTTRLRDSFPKRLAEIDRKQGSLQATRSSMTSSSTWSNSAGEGDHGLGNSHSNTVWSAAGTMTGYLRMLRSKRARSSQTLFTWKIAELRSVDSPFGVRRIPQNFFTGHLCIPVAKQRTSTGTAFRTDLMY